MCPQTVKGIRPMTEFEKTYQNYNPRQAALDEALSLIHISRTMLHAASREAAFRSGILVFAISST